MISLTTMPKNPSMAILPVAMGTKNGSNDQYTGRIFNSAKGYQFRIKTMSRQTTGSAQTITARSRTKVGRCKVEIGRRTGNSHSRVHKNNSNQNSLSSASGVNCGSPPQAAPPFRGTPTFIILAVVLMHDASGQAGGLPD